MEPKKPPAIAKPRKDVEKPTDTESEKKFTYAEILFLMMFAIGADIANVFPILNIFVTIVTLFVTQIYFKFKGVKSGFNLVMQLLEFIPFLSIIPMMTMGVLVTIIMANNPRLDEKVQKATSVATPKVPTPTS